MQKKNSLKDNDDQPLIDQFFSCSKRSKASSIPPVSSAWLIVLVMISLSNVITVDVEDESNSVESYLEAQSSLETVSGQL